MRMAETETAQVKVQIDVNGMRYEASGSASEIIPQILQFLLKAVPTYDLARKLVYVPDLAGLADKVSEFARMTTTGQLLLTRNDLSTDKAVSTVLFMAHLASKMGKRGADSLSIEEIATAVGRAPKTIRNVIVNLQKFDLIERVDRDAYRITQKGLMELENSLTNAIQRGGTPE
jgi:predicted transcriptional regulator